MLTELFAPFKNPQSLKRMIVLVVVCQVFALPFSAMEFVPVFSNLRPVTALIPIYGIFFGPVGCWAYAIANLLYDVLSGTLVISSIGGFVGNFIASALFWALSRHFIFEGHLLGSVKAFASYTAVAIAAALALTGAIIFWIALFYANTDALATGLFIFGNNLFFFLIPGAGLAILMSTEFGRQPIVSEESGKKEISTGVSR